MAKITYSDCLSFQEISSNKRELITRKAWRNDSSKPFAILLDDVNPDEYCSYSRDQSLQYLKGDTTVSHFYYALVEDDKNAEDWMTLSLQLEENDDFPPILLGEMYVATPRWDLNKVFSVLDFKGLSLYDKVIGADSVSELKVFVQNFYNADYEIPHGELVGITEQGFHIGEYQTDRYPYAFVYKLGD